MLPAATSYDDLCAGFQWHIPGRYNIGVDVCDRWAVQQPNRVAITFVGDHGTIDDITYADLRNRSNQLANVLANAGISPGDRVAILLPQVPATAVAHIAVYKSAAIAIPLFTLFGVDALRYRLADAGAVAVITDTAGAAKLAAIRDGLPDLRHIFIVDEATGLDPSMAATSGEFTPVPTAADDPAVIIYTSGTTGPPKGALHAHRVLLGHLPGVEVSHDLFPQPGDKIWTPADWAWIGGLFDVLLPALHHGVPVVARRFAKFTGEAAFALIRDQGIRNAFLPPTALKLMRALADPPALNLRTVASGGEPLGPALLDWGREALGVTINEFYGQTECNMTVSSCAALMPPRPGVTGRPVPGHDVAIVDAAGEVVAPGELGTIAVRRPDPVMFLGYWNNPTATTDKFAGDWMLTGDTGVRDADGWIRFVGRDDDVITSGGYRIGPGEVEDCLIAHPAVKMAAVVGKPDPVRTQIVTAFIVLREDAVFTPGLAGDIQNWVKHRLAAHEYPREITFVETLPMTSTGKIIRRELRAAARS